MASISRSVLRRDRSDALPKTSKAYIAVMGATGSGKSSLVSSITGKEGIVGHELESDALETSEVESYEVTIDSTTFVLVDTPGFDDTKISDYEILHAIADWLEKSCEKGQRLSGLVYLHRINNTRMAGSAVRALHLFQRICGEENYKNVILATTFWNKIGHCKDEGIDRERRLLENEGFWKAMKEKGARTARLAQDYKEILPALMDMAEKPKVTLGMEQELMDGLKVEQTMAGLFINKESIQLQEEHEANIVQMEQEFATELEKRHNGLNARRIQREQRLKEQEELKEVEKKQELMKAQLKLYRLNQRVKQAELRARLREEEEEMQARAREQQQQILRQRRESQEKESQQRARLSLSQRRVVNTQLDTLRLACARGRVRIHVAAIEREGVGMTNKDCSRNTVKRSGLNQWCDFCLKPFGVRQWYLCSVCAIDPVSSGFGICVGCYDAGRRCFNRDHQMTSHNDHDPYARVGICSRYLEPHESLYCNAPECKKKIEGLYFHCCGCCGDDLDLCLSCVVTADYHCFDPRHNLVWGVQPVMFLGQELC